MVTDLSIEILPAGVARLTWSIDPDETRQVRVYIDGRLVIETLQRTVDLPIQPGMESTFDVRDSDQPGDPVFYARQVTLQWFGVTDAVSYQIDEYNGSSWVNIGSVEHIDTTYHQWESTALDDQSEHSYRVTAIGATGIASAGVEFDVVMVRQPDVPDLDFEYDAGTGAVTIS